MIENIERGARNIGIEELRAQVDKASFATIDALKSPLGADKRSYYEGLLENLNGARAWMSYNKLRYTSAVVLGITMLTSCAPAVVVVPIPDGEPNRPTITQTAPIPTETATKTATATETPSPESLLPQEVKEKFELAGIDLAQMQNAEYDKGGLHITLPGGEVIVLTNTDLQKGIYIGQDNILQYRGEFQDSVVYTFDKESGKWEVGISEAESAAIKLLDQYGVDPETYTLAEVDGVIVGTDNETGKEIFRDGRFEIGFAIELAKKDCKPTDIEPSADGLLILYQSWGSSETYISEIIKDLNFPSDIEGWGLSILIDREKQCWVWANSSNIYYRDETGLAKAVPIINLTEDEMVEFIINGKFKEELVSP